MYPDNQQSPGQLTQRPSWYNAFEADVLRLVGDALKLRDSELTLDSDMSDFVDGSIHVVAIVNKLSKFYNLSIPPAIYFEVNILRDLCLVLRERHSNELVEFYKRSLGDVSGSG
ncbi:TPA: acyl carrier protein [Pseudomonas aeruginosa]|nr:acyl carrier protein [Pseudomonas aeruginosa]